MAKFQLRDKAALGTIYAPCMRLANREVDGLDRSLS
jgi:hypothetical protein